MLTVPRTLLRAATATLCVCLTASVAAAQAAETTPPTTSTPPQPQPQPPATHADTLAEGQLDLSQALRSGGETLSADQVAARAVKTAPSVTRAKAAAERAAEGASQALVGVYPRLDLQASYTRLSEHDSPYETAFDFDIPGAPQIEFPEPIPDLYVLSATLSYPVSDLFFNIIPLYKAASETVDAQRLSAKAEEHSIALSAREAFYNYARSRATLEVARSSLAGVQSQQRDTKSLVTAGTLARVELMRADAAVAAASVVVARAAGGVAVARTALRSLMHTEGEGDLAIDEELTTPLPPLREDKNALLQQAFRSRSEIAALRTMLRVHERTRDANNAQGYPKLAIQGAVEYANPNQRVDPFKKEFQASWQVSGVLSWSPNDLAISRAVAGRSRADREQTYADIAALEDALRTEVAQGYEAAVAAGQAMDAALTGIAAAEETYRVRREQFRAGAAVATDVVDAEAKLREARLELINAAIDVRIARARLDRAVER